MPTKKAPWQWLPKGEKFSTKIIKGQGHISEGPSVSDSSKPIHSLLTPSGNEFLEASGHLEAKSIRISFNPGSEISYLSKDFWDTQGKHYSETDLTATLTNEETIPTT